LSFHLDELVVLVLVDVRVERFGLSCRRKALGKLPGLEDRLDLGDESGKFRPVVGEPFCCFEVVQELLGDEIPERLVGAELVLVEMSA
jgi:hypothetical protein